MYSILRTCQSVSSSLEHLFVLNVPEPFIDDSVLHLRCKIVLPHYLTIVSSVLVMWWFCREIILKCRADPFHCGMPKKRVRPGLISNHLLTLAYCYKPNLTTRFSRMSIVSVTLWFWCDHCPIITPVTAAAVMVCVHYTFHSASYRNYRTEISTSQPLQAKHPHFCFRIHWNKSILNTAATYM